MRFLIDAMLPPAVCAQLTDLGHQAVTPSDLGAHNLPDDTLLELAAGDDLVIVTENAMDFAPATRCTVVFVRKSWWPSDALACRLATALARWAQAHPNPGAWPHWLEHRFR